MEVRVSGSKGVQSGADGIQINVFVGDPLAGPVGRIPGDIRSLIAGVLRVLEDPAVQAKLAEVLQPDDVPPVSGIPDFGVDGTHPPRAPGPAVPGLALSSPMPFLRDAARLVSTTTTGIPLGKAGLMAVAEVMAAQCGEYDQAQDWLQETASLPEAISDPVQRAAAQALHAWALGECGDRVAARILVNRVRDSISRLAPGEGDDAKAQAQAQAQVRVLVEWVACRQGDKEGSTRLIGALAEVAEQQSDPLTRSVFFGGLAWTYFLAGSADQAEPARLLDRAVTAALGCDDRSGRIISLLFAAWVAGQLAELKTARALLFEVEENARGIWHPDLRCIVLSVAAVAAAQAGDPALADHLRRAATSVGFSKDWKFVSLALAAWLRDAPSRMRTNKYISATRRQKSPTLLARAGKLAKNNVDVDVDNKISFSVELAIDGVQVLAMLARAWAVAAGGHPAAAARVIAEAARLIRSMKFGGSRILMLGIASCVARGTGVAYQSKARELVAELLIESDKLVVKSDDSIAADDPGPESDGHSAEDERGLPSWACLLLAAWIRAQQDGPAMATVAAAAAMVNVAGAPAEDRDDEVLAWCTGVAWAAAWTGGREQALELVKATEEAASRPEVELVGNFALHTALAWVAAQAGDRERALRLATQLAALAIAEDGAAGAADDNGLPRRELCLIAAAWIVCAGGRPPYQEVVHVLGTLLPSGQGSGSLVTCRDSWITLFKRIALASPA
jgi:hypothetical protein